jgi:hypothetical protein
MAEDERGPIVPQPERTRQHSSAPFPILPEKTGGGAEVRDASQPAPHVPARFILQ